MKAPELTPAQLDADHLAALKELESELDAVVIAYQPSFRPAELNDAQVARLRALEVKLGLILVAFSPK